MGTDVDYHEDVVSGLVAVELVARQNFYRFISSYSLPELTAVVFLQTTTISFACLYCM